MERCSCYAHHTLREEEQPKVINVNWRHMWDFGGFISQDPPAAASRKPFCSVRMVTQLQGTAAPTEPSWKVSEEPRSFSSVCPFWVPNSCRKGIFHCSEECWKKWWLSLIKHIISSYLLRSLIYINWFLSFPIIIISIIPFQYFFL